MSYEQKLLQLLSGKWITAAVSAAAELGLADALEGRTVSPEALAEELGCAEDALLRLLRVLSGEELVEADAHGNYTLTALGAQLKTGQLRELARFVGSPFMWNPWAALATTVRTHQAAFEVTHGLSLFDHLDRHPEDAALYHSAVDAFTRREARALAETFDFSRAELVVDVGGGLGTLLVELGARWPALRCLLYDRPKVIEQAKVGPAAHALGGRLTTLAGDFLEGVPAGADIYVIKHVLHNWDDESAVSLLRRCRERLRPDLPGFLPSSRRPCCAPRFDRVDPSCR